MISRILVSILCGMLFGIGLAISDMVNPTRVLGFLDIAGAWDPTLALVMGGALIPSALAYRLQGRRSQPALDHAFHIPQSRRIDRALVGGAIMFGLGWGLVGLCPGPAFAALVTGRWEIAVFVIAMLVGMFAHRLVAIAALRRSVRHVARPV